MAKDFADTIEITRNQFGYTVKLTKDSKYIYVTFNDFEFIKGGAILFSKFVALKTETRLEFGALETNIDDMVQVYNLWQKTALNCKDAGIKLPFIEFICDGIQVSRLPNPNASGYLRSPEVKELFKIDLINCWTRNEFVHPMSNAPKVRKDLKLYPVRTFADVFYLRDDTSYFHGLFYNAAGKKFIHNRLRIKISQYILTEFGDYYMEFKDADLTKIVYA